MNVNHVSNHLTKRTAALKVWRVRRWQAKARKGNLRASMALAKRGISPQSNVWIDDSPRGRVRYQVLSS